MIVSVLAPSAAARAEPPSFFTGFTKTAEVDGDLTPGQEFTYTFEFSCNSSASGAVGCTNAAITDPLPDWIEYVGPSASWTGPNESYPPAFSHDAASNTVSIAFTDPLADPAGAIGARVGASYQVSIVVKVADDIPYAESGKPILNEATIDATNTDPQTASDQVTPTIPLNLKADAAKRFDPDSDASLEGTPTTMYLTGTNSSNTAVDELVVQDPAGDPSSPVDESNPFYWLGFDGFGTPFPLPAPANQVQVDVFDASTGLWVTGTPGATPALPEGVSNTDVAGLRFTYTNSAGEKLPQGATSEVPIKLVQTDAAGSVSDVTQVENTVKSTVTLGDDSKSSGQKDATYTISPRELSVGAGKTFNPNNILPGEQSDATLTATNTGTTKLSELTITEPDPALESKPLGTDILFEGFTGSAQWPSGTASVTVVYQGAGGPWTATSPSLDTLPGLPAGVDPHLVTGFTITYTAGPGGIIPGAEAEAPFTVSAPEDLVPDAGKQFDYLNRITVDGTEVGTGEKTGPVPADDTLHVKGDNLSVSVAKTIRPDEIWAQKGQTVVAQLEGKVDPFPDSTVPAKTITVTDDYITNPDWWAAFDPTSVPKLTVDADATLTVQYCVADSNGGCTWADVPNAVNITSSQSPFTANLADAGLDPASIDGLRFVYTHTGAGFPGNSVVKPNISFELSEDDNTSEKTYSNCGVADATSPTVSADQSTSPDPCPTVTTKPWDTGNGPDIVDKTWVSLTTPGADPVSVDERSQEKAGVHINWSTGGLSGVKQMVVTETGTNQSTGLPTPATTSAQLKQSSFDTFNLVRLDPINASVDPLFAYDTLVRVELFNYTSGEWETVPGGPWNGSFPGYDIPNPDQITGVRYVFEENAAARANNDFNLPQPGSGVAVSSGNNRVIPLVFQLRDDLRSDPSTPVLFDGDFNDTPKGTVNNTASAVACTTVLDENGVCSDPMAQGWDEDQIFIDDSTANLTVTKEWSDDALGIPSAGQPAPISTVTLTAKHQGALKVDQITLADPNTDPTVETGASDDTASAFSHFDLDSIRSITLPEGAPRADAEVLFTMAPGATVNPSCGTGLNPCTIDNALALASSALVDVIGVSVVANGRIVSGDELVVQLDMKLRTTIRGTNTPVTAVNDLDNTVVASISDPALPSKTFHDTTKSAGNHDSINLVDSLELKVAAGKSFSPDSSYEGGSPSTVVTLTGKPSGTARANQLTLTDTAPRFWNAFTFTGLSNDFAIATPANRVKIEVLTGASYEVGCTNPDAPTLTVSSSGTWATIADGEGNTWLSADQAKSALSPTATSASTSDGSTVDYADIVGVRLSYERVASADINEGDAVPLLWNNPASPTISAPLNFDRRDTLRAACAGQEAVSTDYFTNPPAPGQDAPGVFTNTVIAEATGPSATADPDSASKDIEYLHHPTKVAVDKTPSGAQGPGATVPFKLTFTNTGSWPIINPVFQDVIQQDANGPMLVLPQGTTIDTADNYAFELSGGSTPPDSYEALPTDVANVTISAVAGTDAAPTTLQFAITDPTDPSKQFALGIGQTYTITVKLALRADLPETTQIKNTAVINQGDGGRLFDDCTPTPTSGTAPYSTCADDTSVSVRPTGSMDGSQYVKAVGADALGVVPWSGAPTTTCATSPVDQYYSGNCLPVTRPGGLNEWKLDHRNSGSRPLQVVRTIAYLPSSGPSGVMVDNTGNTTLWNPTLQSFPQLVGAPSGAELTVRYTTAPKSQICVGVLTNNNGSCAAGTQAWVELSAAEFASMSESDRAAITALYFETDFRNGTALGPAQSFSITMQTTASWAADEPLGQASTPAWNSLAMRGWYQTQAGVLTPTPPLEIPTVGATLATGTVQVAKTVSGDAAGEAWVPTEFSGSLKCVIGPDDTPMTGLEPVILDEQNGYTYTLEDEVPLGARCGFAEDYAGATVTMSPETVTVTQQSPAVASIAVNNAYDYATLDISKVVDTAAVDADGTPIPYGPFSFTVACTFLGNPVYADGYSADSPMTNDNVVAGESWLLNKLPAHASCVVTETDSRGAEGTTISVTGPAGTITGDDTVTIPDLSTSPDSTTVNVEATNSFGVGSLTVTKIVDDKDPEGRYGTGPFTLAVACTLVDDSHPAPGISVWNGTVVLPTPGADPDDPASWSHTIDNIASGATCVVTEPDEGNGAASSTTITTVDGQPLPESGVTISSVDDAVVNVTNTFEVGSIDINKTVIGNGAELYGAGPFTVRLQCSYEKNGDTTSITWGQNDYLDVVLSAANGYSATVDNLLVGASCAVTSETVTGGATSTDLGDSVTVPATDDPDQTEPVAIEVTNTFTAGPLTIEKKRVGSGAAAYGAGPFPVAVTCTWSPDGKLTSVPLPDGGHYELSESNDYTVQIPLIPIGASCHVVETDKGKAISVEYSPSNGDVSIVEPTPFSSGATVTITNTFVLPNDLGGDDLENTGANPEAIGLIALAIVLIIGGAVLTVTVRRKRS